MSDEASVAPPSGWYPDPSGARQWRHWDGSTWTPDTREYSPLPAALVERLPAIHAQRALRDAGVVAWFAGLGLLIDTWRTAHYANSLPDSITPVLVAVGLAALVLGWITYARAVLALRPQDPLALLPFANTVRWIARVIETSSSPLGWPGAIVMSRRSVLRAATSTQLAIIVAVALGALLPVTNNPLLVVVAAAPIVVGAVVNLLWARVAFDDVVG